MGDTTLRAVSTLNGITTRINAGMATARDVTFLLGFIDALVWERRFGFDGRQYQLCRACDRRRGTPHAATCPAKEVA
jgi:hypothetical protein